MAEKRSPDGGSPANRPGRRPSTNAAELERAAFDLFARDGFEATTVEGIAAEVGISKRTFFRYFESKNDVVWGDFGGQLEVMRAHFARCPDGQPIMDAVRAVVVEFNRFDPAQVPWHRKRMELILKVPALQAHSTLRFRDWRAVVADFAAARLGTSASELIPQSIANVALGVALAAYEYWLAHPEEELADIMNRAFEDLASGFGMP
ncbi:mycofactocin system transcriptional regulator [Nocardia transvalensis]|uniref:Mycofactocin system transcriptional regulator n=1 Tax=Nocardia transvalensis TaxID=37333 RepID=A0A7W9PLW9_9NOCA|nr:mycofactocin system transcriptional regulator [Nocardia transvalensis]MBB5918340.1 mycofactocin system transcriptional regulator [Nocardia transvalensis]